MGTPVPMKSREMECIGADPKIDTRQLTEEEKKRYFGHKQPPVEKPSTAVLFSDIRYEEKQMEVMLMDKSGTITPPAKADLIQCMLGTKGKTKAIELAAKEFKVSGPTIYKWIHSYEIQFDKDGRVVVPEDFIPEADQRSNDEDYESNIKEVNGVITGIEYLEDPNDPNELTLAAQPGEGQTIYPEPTEDKIDNTDEHIPFPQNTGETSSGEEHKEELASEQSPVNIGQIAFDYNPEFEVQIKGVGDSIEDTADRLIAKIYYAKYVIGSAYIGVDFEKEKILVSPGGLNFKEAAALVELLNDIL